MKITIALLDKENVKVKDLTADTDLIANATMIIHEGKHYAFSNTSGRFFTDVKFVECNPPVVID